MAAEQETDRDELVNMEELLAAKKIYFSWKF